MRSNTRKKLDDQAPENTAQERKFASIPIEMIAIDKDNPRLEIHEWDVEERMRSIKKLGLLTPVLVRPEDDAWKKFRLVAGATRIEACKRLGWTRVDALVETMSPEKSEDATLAENLQRAQITVFEVYAEVCRRRKKYGDDLEQMEARTGVATSQLEVFYNIEDKCCPSLLRKFELDPRPEIMNRLRMASRIKGRNDMERHEAQRLWWKNQGWSLTYIDDDKKGLRKRKFYVSMLVVKQIAKRVVEQLKVRGPDGEWIRIDRKTALAIENAILWAREPAGREWPEDYV